MAQGEKIAGVSLERNTLGNNCDYLALLCLLERYFGGYKYLANVQNKNRLFDLGVGASLSLRRKVGKSIFLVSTSSWRRLPDIRVE